MARTRLLNPEVFLHEDLAACSPHARLLFLSLWTQADREGRLRWLPARVLGEAFPHEPGLDVQALGAELVGAEVLVLYEVNGRRFGALPNFLKHQKPHRNETASSCPQPPLVDQRTTKGQPKDDQRTTKGQPKVAPIRTPDSGEDLSIERSCEQGLRPYSPDIESGSSCSARERGTIGGEGINRSLGSRSSLGSRGSRGSRGGLEEFVRSTWPKLTGSPESFEGWLEASAEAYPDVDLLGEARKARAWEQSNPGRKKKQIRRFLGSWWSRAQERGGSSPASLEDEALAVARSLGATF